MVLDARRMLRHPLFLGALIVLLVNDHLLKGAGLLPPWLTGKLSDFAGLIVAPTVLGVVLGATRAGLRGQADSAGTDGTTRHMAAMSVLVVAGVFVATELSQGAADGVASILTAVGLPTRFWADPTDLIALAVLPLTCRVLAPVEHRSPEPLRAWSPPLARTVLALAVIACVATSPRPTSWATSAYLLNGTDTPIDVRVRWASLELSCAELGDRSLSSIVSEDVLTSGVTFRVEVGSTIPLDDWAALAARGAVDAGLGRPRPPADLGEGCVIALVAVDDAPDTLLSWSTATTLAVPVRSSEGTLPSTGRVEVASLGESLALEVSPDVTAEPFDARTMPSRCELPGEVGTSDATFFDGPAHEVVGRTDGSDGCVRLDFAMGTRPAPFFVCAPAALVPFAVGDFVRVDVTDERGVHTVALTGEGRTLVLLRARGTDPSTTSVIEGGVTLSMGPPDACGGERLECGSFVVPHVPAISGASAGEDPRGVVMRTSPTGRSMRIQVARAESVVAASSLCAEGRGDAGPLLDAVVLYE